MFLGQLGTQAWSVDYAQYAVDQNGKALTGKANYQIVFPADLPLIADDKRLLESYDL